MTVYLAALMNQRIALVEEALQQHAQGDVAVAVLQTHPGIGLLTSLALRYTLLPISRFSTTRQATAYVGLDCMEDSSSEHLYLQGGSRAVEVCLRWSSLKSW
jgi:transposase